MRRSLETLRINTLRDEQVYIQKKTFTNWANSFLNQANMKIDDLFSDLANGRILMKLLEIISGENLGKPTSGRMRVQKAENINRCLSFLRTKKVYFENIGAEDIMDGNKRLILGLIWTIILSFDIEAIRVEVNKDGESSEERSAKDALLLWCQRKTAGYPGVDITNFTNSWRNGLGFNALIHAHRPGLIVYEHLVPADHMGNLNNAFDVVGERLGIPKILDAEDVDVDKPDEKSIITYVASYYHYFAKMKSEKTGGKCIEDVSREKCPICHEDLHLSKKDCFIPNCGHKLHRDCLKQRLEEQQYGCPVCKRTVVDVQKQWKELHEKVASTPMAEEHRDYHVMILCYDCQTVNTVLYHSAGVKCPACGSYNTIWSDIPNVDNNNKSQMSSRGRVEDSHGEVAGSRGQVDVSHRQEGVADGQVPGARRAVAEVSRFIPDSHGQVPGSRFNVASSHGKKKGSDFK